MPDRSVEPLFTAERIAQAFHETYERLAPEHIRSLMIAVVADLLARGVIHVSDRVEPLNESSCCHRWHASRVEVHTAPVEHVCRLPAGHLDNPLNDTVHVCSCNAYIDVRRGQTGQIAVGHD
jgi:hypothetical protein